MCAASLVAGCLAVTALASGQSTPQASAQSPVTVYYEKMPDGTIRQVSSAPPPLATTEKKSDSAIKTTATSGSAIQLVKPMPQMEIRTYSSNPMAAPLVRIENNIPVQREVIPAPAAPMTLPNIVTTYQRIEGGVRPAESLSTMPVQTPAPMQVPQPMLVPTTMPPAPMPAAPIVSTPTPTPAVPVLKPVVMKQSSVLPELPPIVDAPIAAKAPQTLPGLPAEAPAKPTIFQPTQSPMPPVQNTTGGETEKQETLADYNIEVRPPSLDRLYRMDSESKLKTRIIEEVKTRPVKETNLKFPEYKALTDERYQARQMGGLIKQIEPQYLIHGRLYCEELNAERYGWDFGVIHPLVSSAIALKDFALLPHNFATRPCQRFEASSGKCFPGDPVPYLLYPPEFSVPGAALETGVFLAAFAIVP